MVKHNHADRHVEMQVFDGVIGSEVCLQWNHFITMLLRCFHHAVLCPHLRVFHACFCICLHLILCGWLFHVTFTVRPAVWLTALQRIKGYLVSKSVLVSHIPLAGFSPQTCYCKQQLQRQKRRLLRLSDPWKPPFGLSLIWNCYYSSLFLSFPLISSVILKRWGVIDKFMASVSGGSFLVFSFRIIGSQG